jgi:hypothetical protein
VKEYTETILDNHKVAHHGSKSNYEHVGQDESKTSDSKGRFGGCFVAWSMDAFGSEYKKTETLLRNGPNQQYQTNSSPKSSLFDGVWNP